MNSEAIISRLKTVLDYYDLTSSTFADTIEVQRSSISHLMSGRNKPSLDFVMKVIDKYPAIDLYWLLNGEGSFPKKKGVPTPIQKEIVNKVENPTLSLFAQNAPEDEQVSNTRFSASTKKLIKVVLLYDNGSFEEFNQDL